MSQPRPVVVIIGAGCMGLAIARRLGPSHHLLISDSSPTVLSAAESSLRSSGHFVTSQPIDITRRESVTSFAETAASLGSIRTVVVTAGISNANNDTRLIYTTNLVGAALVIELFLPHMAPGGSLTIIASVAGHMKPLNMALDDHFATAPVSELLDHAGVDFDSGPSEAYCASKRGCIVRARYAAAAWGRRGARINTVSPGVCMTTMIEQVLQSKSGPKVRAMVDAVPLGRIGTVDDVAGAVAFLVGPDASYINGTDLIVDGGSRSVQRWRQQ